MNEWKWIRNGLCPQAAHSLVEMKDVDAILFNKGEWSK